MLCCQSVWEGKRARSSIDCRLTHTCASGGQQDHRPRQPAQADAAQSTIAFLMTLPLFTLMIVLVAYPTGFAIYLSMLDRSMTRFVGLDNFAFLVGRDGSGWSSTRPACLPSPPSS